MEHQNQIQTSAELGLAEEIVPVLELPSESTNESVNGRKSARNASKRVNYAWPKYSDDEDSVQTENS